ncbi:PAS domain-containing protein [Sorangium sp. So ce1036]|uniref:PAS domain-containing protein n=1 Tax=Sorangium sp. So ce1036 TaxID=3133328 RepID=UPI003F01FA8C
MSIDDVTVDSLEEENRDLRRRLAELEQRLAAYETASGPARVEAGERAAGTRGVGPAAVEHVDMLAAILDNAPLYIYAKDIEGRYLLFNRRCEEIAGRSFEEVAGKTDFELQPREAAEMYERPERQVIASGKPLQIEEEVPTAAGTLHVLTIKFPLVDAAGRVYGVCGISSDLTEQRRAEQENQRLQAEVVRMQEATLRALSTPLIPIARGVLVMPLIGDVDRRRAEQMLETLLAGVSARGARIAILDVTGVPRVGPEVADGLVRVARAVGLLGAQVVLTGIQPRLAQELVGMGDGLSGLVTRSTLESGIAYAMSAVRG